jgi:hypothetical protein
LIYDVYRYAIEEPIPGQYDKAWIARDEEDIWQGGIGVLGVGDRRYYNEKVYNAELAFRFRNIDIPADAEILSASLSLLALSDIDAVVNSKISIEDSIAALSFPGTGVYANFVGRSRLETMVEWNNIASWGNAWADKRTPDFSNLIQNLVSLYGAINKGAITVFWGDRDGNTPMPAESKANFIKAQSIGGYAVLHVVFEVINVIEEPFPGIFYGLGSDQINDATYGVDDENIINDVRVIIPRYEKELDYSYEPPIWKPIDFKVVNIDELSQQKYGRRTRINKEAVGNWLHFASTYCEQTIEDCKEPIPSMTLTIVAADDEEISKLLAIRIIDKLLITVDEAGIDKRFWIDSKVLTLGASHILATFGLREITSLENIPHVFRVGYDKIGDMEAILG